MVTPPAWGIAGAQPTKVLVDPGVLSQWGYSAAMNPVTGQTYYYASNPQQAAAMWQANQAAMSGVGAKMGFAPITIAGTFPVTTSNWWNAAASTGGYAPSNNGGWTIGHPGP
jgi:hypothetical protein